MGRIDGFILGDIDGASVGEKTSVPRNADKSVYVTDLDLKIAIM
jgi:hypothetical protein